MARVNVGLNPRYLADQHLVAESVEITMITGQLKKAGYVIKGKIPKEFPLGPGHMNFFKDKLLYLNSRLESVNTEMRRRGFNPGTSLKDVLTEAPETLLNDWIPTTKAFLEIRDRVCSRLITRTNGRPGQGFYRYQRTNIQDIKDFVEKIKSEKKYIF